MEGSEQVETNETTNPYPDLSVFERHRKLLKELTERFAWFNQLVENRRGQLKAQLVAIDNELAQLEQIVDHAQVYDKEGKLAYAKEQYIRQARVIQIPPGISIQNYQTRAEEALNQYSKGVNDVNKTRRTALIIGVIVTIFICILVFSFIMSNFRNGSPDIGLFLLGPLAMIVYYIWAKNNQSSSRTQLLEKLGACYIESLQLAKNRSEAVQQQTRSEIQEFQKQFQRSIEMLQSDLDAVEKASQPLSMSWEASYWQDWQPGLHVAPFIRIGELSASSYGLPWTAHNPALLKFPEELNLLFLANGVGKQTAANAVQSLLLRMLVTVPPGKLRFTFIDPVGLGQNVSPFMLLADYDENQINGKAWSSPEQIKQRLNDLTEHTENVIQKYLRNQYATIEEYNAQAGEIAEPYRVLVVFDFPMNFSDEAARHLVSISQNGPRCGVFTIIIVDTEKPLPYGFNPQELERSAIPFAWNGKTFLWNVPEFRSFTLVLDSSLPDSASTNRLIAQVGEAAKGSTKVEVPFEKMLEIFARQLRKFPNEYAGFAITVQANDPTTWWKASTADELIAPLGRAGAEKIQCLRLGKATSQHALIAGKTGSGKSTLLHTLILSLALSYSPDEIELYMIDFKKGVEFKTYATYQIPHARVIAIESEREFGLSVLQGLNDELSHRGDIYKKAGGVHSLRDFRLQSGQSLPRILLIVDEFQEFFTEDDALASQASQILDRLVRQGRAFGIHILLGSQTLAGAYSLARSTIDQMAVRMALQCSEADSRLILADENPAARLLSRPGEAIYNAENGQVQGNSRFQVAWLTDDQRDQTLGAILNYSKKVNYHPPRTPVYFEGNAPADLSRNLDLNEKLKVSSWPEMSLAPSTWIGDPVAIRDPVAVSFHRQSSANLLVVGSQETNAYGLLTAAVVGLAAQISPVEPNAITVIDFCAADSPFANWFTDLSKSLNYPIRFGRRRQLPDLLSELVNETQDRLDNDSINRPPRFLFLVGLQRARDLRPDDSFGSYSMDTETPAANLAQQWNTILKDGPEFGIHTVAWCDTYTNLTRSLERRMMHEFGMRVVFQVSGEDSSNLIDSPAASKLGPFRALYYNEDEGHLEKFRPYAAPEPTWLAMAASDLKNKS